MSTSFEPRSKRGGTEILILRLLIAGLVAALGVALWVSGHVLVGGLILALAVVRLVLFLTMRHRRSRWRQTSGARRRPNGPGAHPTTYPSPAGHPGGAGYAAPARPTAPVPYQPPS